MHGTLRDPIWEYLYSHDAALGHFALQQTPFGLVGHTHVPAIVIEDDQLPRGCEIYRLSADEIVGSVMSRGWCINPGSVGQPRDGDPRAAYGLYDSEEALITLHRVEYQVAKTQMLMEEAGLPRWLIERLAEGR